VLVPVLVLIVWIGVYPQPFLRTTEASVNHLLAQVQARTAPSAERRAQDAAPAEVGTAGAQGDRGAGGQPSLDEPPIASVAAAIEMGQTARAGASTHGGRHGE